MQKGLCVMYEAMVFSATFLLVISAFDYVRHAWIGETKPVLATWILMMVVMTLSLWIYWNNPNKSLTSNIGVTSGIVNIAIILVGVIAANIRYGILKVAFDRTQKQCLTLGGVVVMFWFFTNQTLLSYILVQCIALIAYFATVKRLWSANGSTEALFLWVCVFLDTLCAIYPAMVKQDLFSYIYLARAIPSTLGVIYLIYRAKQRGLQTT